jgi:hypothetical protein
MDRIAVSADGNFRDEDDIGGPMTFALLVAADTTDRLVYYGYRSHIWNPESSSALKRFNGRTRPTYEGGDFGRRRSVWSR